MRASGVPRSWKIFIISSVSELPGKRGFWFTISAKMHPSDQMSTGVE